MNTVSVTDLRQDASTILKAYVIQNSHPRVVILDADYYPNLQEPLEDYIDVFDSH